MNLIKQTILHDPENGIHGNCLSAVLSSLLHIPICDIPVFSNDDTWVKDLNAWLRPLNLAYLSFDGSSDEWLKTLGIEGLYHEIGGPSPRYEDTLHACVGKDGELLFDPHPDNTLLKEVESFGVLIALRPWEVVTPLRTKLLGDTHE